MSLYRPGSDCQALLDAIINKKQDSKYKHQWQTDLLQIRLNIYVHMMLRIFVHKSISSSRRSIKITSSSGFREQKVIMNFYLLFSQEKSHKAVIITL